MRLLIAAIAVLLSACGGSDAEPLPPSEISPPVYVPPPPPPPPPADAILTMRFRPPNTTYLGYGLQCYGERRQSYYDCDAPSPEAIVDADFEVRVSPNSLQDVFGINSEDVRSATLTLVLGSEYGSKTLTVPVINMAYGNMIDRENYWCAENTKCDRWWWSAVRQSDGSNVFRNVSSWVDETTGRTFSVSLGFQYFSGESVSVLSAIVVTLRGGGKETQIVLSGPLIKQ